MGRGGGGVGGLAESDLAGGAARGVAGAVFYFNWVGLGWCAARGGLPCRWRLPSPRGRCLRLSTQARRARVGDESSDSEDD